MMLLLSRNTFLVCLAVFVRCCNALVVPPEPLVHTAIGAMAGSAGAIAAYPIDFVKSQLQTEEGRTKYSNGGLHAAIDIVRQDGPLALYRGLGVNVVGVAPEKTIKLSVNDFVRTIVQAQNGGTIPLVGEVLAGGIAGMTQVIVTNPLEVVKVRLQTSSLTIKQVTAQIKGLMDMYQGVEACVARDAMFSATLFPLYAHAKVALAVLLGGTFWANMIAGSLAAAPAAFVSTPADVVKTRMQYQEGDAKFLEVASSIINEEGAMVLFSGWFERVIRSAPQFGVTLAMFDVLTTMAQQNGLLIQ